MPVPADLKVNAHVFCFAQSMIETSDRLNGFLPDSQVSHFRPIDGKTLLILSPGCKTKKVAWIVGHGDKSTRRIYNDDSGMEYLLSDLISKLVEWGYTTIVDTCCEPNARKKTNMKGLQYWCATDGQIVGFLSGFAETQAGFNQWWDSYNFYQYS
jgi:hypothetical protein